MGMNVWRVEPFAKGNTARTATTRWCFALCVAGARSPTHAAVTLSIGGTDCVRRTVGSKISVWENSAWRQTVADSRRQLVKLYGKYGRFGIYRLGIRRLDLISVGMGASRPNCRDAQ